MESREHLFHSSIDQLPDTGQAKPCGTARTGYNILAFLKHVIEHPASLVNHCKMFLRSVEKDFGRVRGGVRTRGLTMVELAAVVAITAVLALMLIPAALSARHRAFSSVCQSRLWQLGMSMHWYTADFADQMPPQHAGYYVYFATPPAGPMGIGYLYAWNYVTTPSQMSCPRTIAALLPGHPDAVPAPGQAAGCWWTPAEQAAAGGSPTGTNRSGYWTWFSQYSEEYRKKKASVGHPQAPPPRGRWSARNPNQAWLTCFNVSLRGPDMNHGRPNTLFADLAVETCSAAQVKTLSEIGFWWNDTDYGTAQFNVLDRTTVAYTGDHDRGHGNDPDHFDEDNPGRARGLRN